MTVLELEDMLLYDTGRHDGEITVFIEDTHSGTRHEVIGVSRGDDGVQLHISNDIL